MILCACGAAVAGLTLLPFCAHRMLVHKYRQIAESEPELQRMSELGMVPQLGNRVQAWREPLPYSWRILCACATAGMAGVLAACSPSAVVSAYSWLAFCFCVVLALIDARASILPYEMTVALVPIGACFQALLITEGITTIGQTLTGAGLYCLVLLGAAGIAQFVTKKPALGHGDIRATPGFALLCAAAPFEALAATTVSMGGAFIVFRVLKAESLADSAPFGPFLTIGAATAMLANAIAPV